MNFITNKIHLSIYCRIFFFSVLLNVDGKEYRGQVKGEMVGLDLRTNLYVGGLPDFTLISKGATFQTGFIGENHFSARC